eukprot:CAMPEP_0181126366 /NCGR_PEP_ID=MMETSP1071-20121207/27587_1 /TAXON_ID=35127 /ORGANISM="Thalassiosira sp., Strain NH16" /LENGTH=1274 /DNA_ID=CAMNT_0023211955 /DNA_START=204 /DNA_END=4025 /DNA_ORIENTATION=+
MDCKDSTRQNAHGSDTATPSRRVRFGYSSDSKTINTVERPRKKSRWDVRPRYALAPSAQSKLSHEEESNNTNIFIQKQQQDDALADKEPSKKRADITTPPKKSILRKSNDLQCRSIPKKSNTPHVAAKIRDEPPSEVNSSVISCKRVPDEPKRPHTQNYATGKSGVQGGDLYLHSNSRWAEYPSEKAPKISPNSVDVVEKDAQVNETGNIMHSKRGREMLKSHIEQEESRNKMQSTREESIEASLIEEKKQVNGKKLTEHAKSIHLRKSFKAMIPDPKPIRESRATKEYTSGSKQDQRSRSKRDAKKKRKEQRREERWSQNGHKRKDAEPSKSKTKPEHEDILERGSTPKQVSPVPNEDDLGLKQDYSTSRLEIDTKRNDDGSKSTRAMLTTHPKPMREDSASLQSKIEPERGDAMKADWFPKREKSTPKSMAEDVASSFKKKDFSPFRVKVGCVVAVRFRKLVHGGNPDIVSAMKDGDSFSVVERSSGSTATLKASYVGRNGNSTDLSESSNNKLVPPDEYSAISVSECSGKRKEVDSDDAVKQSAKGKSVTKRKAKSYEVWSAPIAGHDDGMSLLWIRCAFPKKFVAKWQEKNTQNGRNSSLGRFLEGNVISVLGNDGCNERGIKVFLLVDRTSIKSLPYLQALSDGSNDPTVSSSEQKRRKLEAKIRGENKVVVKVTLVSVFDQRNGSKIDQGAVSQWIVRKRVSAKPAGKIPTKKERKKRKQHAQSLFVGDINDTQLQQEQNWRWIASRTASQPINASGHSVLGNNAQDSFSQLVGEVIKMDTRPAQDGSTSLATVTIKRLHTPEQVKGGRRVQHRPMELFDSNNHDVNGLYFQAPIEDLIVIGKRINRHIDVWKKSSLASIPGDDPGWNFIATHSYDPSDDTFMPLCEDVAPKDGQCLQQKGDSFSCNANGARREPYCTDNCEFRVSSSNACKLSTKDTTSLPNEIGTTLSDLVAPLQTSSSIDFTLPNDLGQLFWRPSFFPITVSMKNKSYSKTKESRKKKPGKVHGKSKRKRALSDIGMESRKESNPGEEDVFRLGSSRIVPFDKLNTSCWGASKLKFVAANDSKQPFFRHNASPRVIKIGKTEEKTSLSGRAARANQRRMFKSLASMGDSCTPVDRLAGRDREQQLRFDKSQIHGWGVYAEEAINAGEMIIEYRGEIIGNAVADKRELEYHRTKLDDYMFRIDAYTVCDATMKGNVARYINSSCGPNCHTQIITAGENKRIVIYAKRDIHRGEELSYDYKFALEYDPAKRIPCHCGSLECRGFMNW